MNKTGDHLFLHNCKTLSNLLFYNYELGHFVHLAFWNAYESENTQAV